MILKKRVLCRHAVSGPNCVHPADKSDLSLDSIEMLGQEVCNKSQYHNRNGDSVENTP
jgi:hypothetical protein